MWLVSCIGLQKKFHVIYQMPTISFMFSLMRNEIHTQINIEVNVQINIHNSEKNLRKASETFRNVS
eukprot:c25602_g2_i1 orf=1118-1315(+)